jgi:hypothetical protein
MAGDLLLTLFTPLLYIVYGIVFALTYPLRGLNDVVLDANINNAISTAGGYLAIINQIAPITTLLVILGLVLTIEGFIFLYKIVMWIIRKIPTIS